MHPLNPFLANFFKSSIPAQCAPVHHHILLVPLTDVLLTHREADSGSSVTEVCASEDFLASHVLRIPNPGVGAGGKETLQTLREGRGKAKQYSTLNGKSVIIKDAFVYSNKGFKSLAQAQILSDSTWYPDVFEPRQWLLYFISKPLIGTWEEVKIKPAVLVHNVRQKQLEEARKTNGEAPDTGPKKKDVKNFHDLLNNFPMIARQMQPGLEKIFVEFTAIFQKPLPAPPSASEIPDPLPDGPITIAAKQARSNSASLPMGSRPDYLPITENFYAEDDENIMRASLETAVTTAIDLFQGVDKQQLSLLGATTDLTGPIVEKLIERYITENIHHLLFPRLNALRRPEDLELEAKIRQMEYIDISQLGIVIEGGSRAKHGLILQLGPAIEEFKKITSAMSPQDMMDCLLSTMKLVSHLTNTPENEEDDAEKTLMTVNADTLVSLLLYVVIGSQVRNLQARLMYVRNFIFIEDVESGEIGYALSTFEAVLTYLSMDSAGLRRASRRNKVLWDATKAADMPQLRNIMEPTFDNSLVNGDDDAHRSSRIHASHLMDGARSLTNGSSRRSSVTFSTQEYSLGSDLNHVFPFQSHWDMASFELPMKKPKRVSMDTRSLSSGSEISFHSRASSMASIGTALEGDISVERLSQTTDAFGESVMMMAIQHEQAESLRYLLSLSTLYPLEVVLEDMNNEDTTLLSAAVQLGHADMINMILDHISSSAASGQMRTYLAKQDIWGRSVGHYMFHAPYLIRRLGKVIPWRQRDKNGQTPLFALCRSYDHAEYHEMVMAALLAAAEAQNDDDDDDDADDDSKNKSGNRNGGHKLPKPLHVEQHVDNKGNTLLHVINDATLLDWVLRYCDPDVNASNDRRFTALMLASKYGRYDMVRRLYADPRMDIGARDARGLTAVELAKDDDVRNKIDDLGLFSMPAGPDGRITGVVRAFFVEDGSVRMVLKSAAPTDRESYTVTTSRRSLSDFEHLVRLLEMENPASWIPSMDDNRSPFQIPTRPSRAIMRDQQTRSDAFLKVMLNHPTFATHEMLWEFFLVPELQLDTMEQRTKLMVATRTEKIRDEYEPVEDMREVEQFVNHAREMVRSVNYAIKSVTRRANNVGLAFSDMHDSSVLLHRALVTLAYLPASHKAAFESYVLGMAPPQSSAQLHLHSSLLAVQSTIQALLSALGRPTTMIAQIQAAKREAERNSASTNRSSRWPLGLLDDTRQRLQEEKEERVRKSRIEIEYLSRELRHTQQTVASELAGWQRVHEAMGRRAIKDYARQMLVQEKSKLSALKTSLRKLRSGGEGEGNGLGKTKLGAADTIEAVGGAGSSLVG